MKAMGISFGNQIGGVAFLGSIGMDVVELCFEDNSAKKEGRETLFVMIRQYEIDEEITVTDSALFGDCVNSDKQYDVNAVNEATLECFADEFDDGYHDRMNNEICKSPFANEIRLTRYAMDLFKKEEYGRLGELFGKEADEVAIPEVDYDRV